MRQLSVVIPALNEYCNLERLFDGIPVQDLLRSGWETEIVLVDNGSTDGTGDKARELGARVVEEPRRGYGRAYAAGIAAALGDVVATGDADLTYPLDALCAMLDLFDRCDIEFLTTNRLVPVNDLAMKRSHRAGNRALSATARWLFGHDFHDSQSGMWIFRRSAWDRMDVRSPGMAFSQEIKNEAFVRGLRCMELTIDYRARGGQVKLSALRDGWQNLRQLFEHRSRVRRYGQFVAPHGAGSVEPVPPPRDPRVVDLRSRGHDTGPIFLPLNE